MFCPSQLEFAYVDKVNCFLDKIFVDELPFCTREGCAQVLEENGAYKGLVKPGKNILFCNIVFGSNNNNLHKISCFSGKAFPKGF